MATFFNSPATTTAPAIANALRTARNGFYLYVPGTGHGTRRTGIRPSMAYAIDAKIDDGFPQTGNVGCTEVQAMPIGLDSAGGICGYPGWPNVCNTNSVDNTYDLSSAGECGRVFANRF
jgi:hypothetical protein